jgi:hypothetical protein
MTNQIPISKTSAYRQTGQNERFGHWDLGFGWALGFGH